MVRLVFRPYTQILRSICTSESLRASIRVSSDFTLFRHSSPSFGSQHICSTSKCFPFSNFTFYLTLFSEFFSSFPHGTCSLSVSRQYLALEGVYLPLEQHSQTTRL